MANELNEEIDCQVISLGYSRKKLPKPHTFLGQQQVHEKWLDNNPIKEQNEIKFVRKEVMDFDLVFKSGIAYRAVDEP
jgi:hypothetical protein